MFAEATGGRESASAFGERCNQWGKPESHVFHPFATGTKDRCDVRSQLRNAGQKLLQPAEFQVLACLVGSLRILQIGCLIIEDI